MLRNNREHLELERLRNETRKLIAERKKLLAEEKKLSRETYLYPLAVSGALVTAITAVASVFFSSFECLCFTTVRPISQKGKTNMSTYDFKARMEELEREHDEWEERMRIKNKGDMYPIWGMLAFGLFCMSLGFMLARSI